MHIMKKRNGRTIILAAALLLICRSAAAQTPTVEAYDDEAWTGYAESVVVYVLDNDYADPAGINVQTVEVVDPPIGGVASSDPSTGEILYVPSNGYWGFDCFTYRYSDNNGNPSNEASVYVYIDEPLLPTADDDYFETGFRESVLCDILGNDYGNEAPLDFASVVITTPPAGGQLTVNGDGTVTYTPDSDTEGDDFFWYTVEDEYGFVSEEAMVNVWVAPNEAPTLNFFADWVEGYTWVFSGFVEDDQSVEGLEIDFGGIIGYASSVLTDEYGYFSIELTLDESAIGTVTATTTDVAQKSSEIASATVDY